MPEKKTPETPPMHPPHQDNPPSLPSQLSRIDSPLAPLRPRTPNNPPLLLARKQALALPQRMHQHRHTARLEILRLAHFIQVVGQLGRYLAQVNVAEGFLLFRGVGRGLGAEVGAGEEDDEEGEGEGDAASFMRTSRAGDDGADEEDEEEDGEEVRVVFLLFTALGAGVGASSCSLY
jgi:hypothetical protein